MGEKMMRNIILTAVTLFMSTVTFAMSPTTSNDHNGFSKAFKKEFGFSPTQYLKRMDRCLGKKLMLEFGGDFMNPTIIKKSAFKVAGYGIKTNITNGNYTKDVASFWINYDGENLESKMYKILNSPKYPKCEDWPAGHLVASGDYWPVYLSIEKSREVLIEKFIGPS